MLRQYGPNWIPLALMVILNAPHSVGVQTTSCRADDSLLVKWYDFPPFVMQRDQKTKHHHVPKTYKPYKDQEVGASNETIDGAMYRLAVDMIKHCCNETTWLDMVRSHGENTSLLNWTLIIPYTVDMASAGAYSSISDILFLPVVPTPGPYLLLNSEAASGAVGQALLGAWQLLVVVVSSAVLAAIVIWALDHYRNPTDFPKPFLRGFWEGLWWAVVTMTTVGYGDKTPRSIAGRIFGILWVFVGVVMTSLLTAALAAAFNSRAFTVADLRGMKVGALYESQEHFFALANAARITGFPTLDAMWEAMGEGDIDVILLDNFLALFHTSDIEENQIVQLDVASRLDHPAVHGMLLQVSNTVDRTCFTRYVMESNGRIYTYLQQLTRPPQISPNKMQWRVSSGLLSGSPVVLGSCVGLSGAAFLIFLIWDRCKHKSLSSAVKPTTQVNAFTQDQATSNPKTLTRVDH